MPSNELPGSEFARDVRTGLCENGRKSLPAKYLYDNLGTALFEAITHLPEYGLTRADERVLGHCAPALPAYLPDTDLIVAELGSGSGSKTRPLLQAFPSRNLARYCPIDVSSESLASCVRKLGDLVPVRPFHASHLDGLRQLRATRPAGASVLLLFLGSTIGNLDPEERATFLSSLRSQLSAGDSVLMGFDLVKPRSQLLAAYDDPTGVTAAFNRNVLGRVNRELGARFELRSFRHVARYDETSQRVEMHLASRCAQDVGIPGAFATCSLRREETIWTESSYKFRASDARHLMTGAGFAPVDEWIDDEWPFLEGLWTVR